MHSKVKFKMDESNEDVKLTVAEFQLKTQFDLINLQLLKPSSAAFSHHRLM